ITSRLFTKALAFNWRKARTCSVMALEKGSLYLRPEVWYLRRRSSTHCRRCPPPPSPLPWHHQNSTSLAVPYLPLKASERPPLPLLDCFAASPPLLNRLCRFSPTLTRLDSLLRLWCERRKPIWSATQ